MADKYLINAVVVKDNNTGETYYLHGNHLPRERPAHKRRPFSSQYRTTHPMKPRRGVQSVANSST